MKMFMGFLLVFFASYAQAECISLSEARELGYTYLIENGEAVFPYVFYDGSPEEIAEMSREFVNELTEYDYDGQLLGYSTLIYSEQNGEQLYEEYLLVTCESKVRTITQVK